MRILYIDPISSSSHINFNIIHINAIRKITTNIDFVIKEGYWNEISIPESKVKYAIPITYITKNKGRLISRFYMCLTLWKIRLNIHLQQYDKIILSTYDEIALFFAFYKKPIYLINHNNIASLNNNIKRFFFKHISSINTHIVFEKYIKDYLNSINILNVIVIKHGLVSHYPSNTIPNEFSYKKKKYLFSPSASSVDWEFVENIIYQKKFITYIENNDIYIILRSNKTYYPPSKHIKIITSYLSKEKYISYFYNAAAILLIYPKSFKYRISGVLMEAISYQKRAIMSDIESFRQYKDLFGIDSYFFSTESLIHSIEFALKQQNQILYLSNNQKEQLMPDYSALL